MKHVLYLLCLVISGAVFSNEPIRINSHQDYTILDRFFKEMIESEEYGYVLEGSKPVCIEQFVSFDRFRITKDMVYTHNEMMEALLVREAIPVWNRLCSQQKNFVLKSVDLDDSPFPSLEVLFINVACLKDVVRKNIELFRFVLGPTVTICQIVDRIIKSHDPLVDILQHNLSLMGIVLGFGSHNSLVGGRLETILALSISKDLAPFTPRSYLMQKEGNHSLDFLTPDRYGLYYLEKAGGDDSNFRNDLPMIQPHWGFGNLLDEVVAIDDLNDPLPNSLWEKPKFVFGAYKGKDSNQPFFNKLQGTQKRIKTLLKKSNFLESVLEKIGGKKPVILLDRSILPKMIPSLINAADWAQILFKASSRFEGNSRKLAFIEAFRNPTPLSRLPPPLIGVSAAAFEGLKTALNNLVKANEQCEQLARDHSFEVISPKQLYFKVMQPGSGKQLTNEERIRIGYVIEDSEGNILFANHDVWLHLSQTIPGFAHGVRGMKVGEKRKIIAHPVFGYGALTTLPPCIALTITVNLMDMDVHSSRELPSLTPLNLGWVQDPWLYKSIQESL